MPKFGPFLFGLLGMFLLYGEQEEGGVGTGYFSNAYLKAEF